MNYRFTLEPYKGVSTRHTCPNCHRKSCFAKYIDTEKQISFPDYVGRCNHEQKCGYNYTPKMYFDENPIAKERLSEEFVPVSKPRISLPPAPSFIEPEIMRQSLKAVSHEQAVSVPEFPFRAGGYRRTDVALPCGNLEALAGSYGLLAGRYFRTGTHRKSDALQS